MKPGAGGDYRRACLRESSLKFRRIPREIATRVRRTRDLVFLRSEILV
jgi:hypothetical protein